MTDESPNTPLRTHLYAATFSASAGEPGIGTVVVLLRAESHFAAARKAEHERAVYWPLHGNAVVTHVDEAALNRGLVCLGVY